jgi:hypothetical protein
VTDHKLAMNSGEMLVESIRANRMEGLRAVGGRLYLTDQRLVFRPHAFDAATGGSAWESPLRAVALADIAPRGSDRSFAALRRRLRITTADGAEVFVVNHVSEVATRIEKARQA